MQAINNIIKKSSYLEDALRLMTTSALEPSTDTNSSQIKTNPDAKAITLRWFNISPEISVIGFDTTTNSYAYDITYVIQPYDTPSAVNPYGNVSPYYGPHKIYDYWFTGKNTEVLGYTQKFDNTYIQIAPQPDGSKATDQGSFTTPTFGNKKSGQDPTGRLGDGTYAPNTYMSSLFDPAAYTDVKIDILGDPDFLMTEAAPSVNEAYRQFYNSDSFTINPNGGEVFIEVNFKEGVDYDNQNGLLNINDNILFYSFGTPGSTSPKSVSYKLREVNSTFSKGKFTQQLNAYINPFPEDTTNNNAGSANQTEATQTRTGVLLNSQGRGNTGNSGTTSTPSANNSTSSNSGLLSDKPVSNQVQTNPNTSPVIPVSTQEQTSIPTQNSSNPSVSNGENVSNTGSTQAGAGNLIDAGGREEPPNP
jgi:hypothetical protein